MTQKKNPFKDIRFIIFVAIVLSLFVLFITTGETESTDTDAEIKENFDVPSKNEGLSASEEPDFSEDPVKDAGLDEAISSMGKDRIDSTVTVKEKDIYSEVPVNTVKGKKYKPRGEHPKSVQPVKSPIKEAEVVQPPSENISRESAPVKAPQGSTWRRESVSQESSSLKFGAVVFGDTKLSGSKSTCKIRTIQDFKVDNIFIPRNTIIVAYLSKGSEVIDIVIQDALVNGEKIQRTFEGYTSEGKGIRFHEENLRSNLKQEGGAIADEISDVNTGNIVTDIATRAVSKTLGDKARKDIITVPDGTKLTFYSIN